MSLTEALTEALDHLLKFKINFYIKRSDKFGGALIVRLEDNPIHLISRQLRSNTGSGFGFFFNKRVKVWINPTYYATTDGNYNNKFDVMLVE